MTLPVLKLTDGTTEIDLIQRNGNAFYLNSWRPMITQMKQGGTWQQSSLSDGRRLVQSQWQNVVETFDLKIANVGPDALVRETQDLRRLLNKALEYWLNRWSIEPVWIETRASNETNTRYALIHSWSTPDDENPFSQPFLQQGGRMMDNFTLTLERGHWLATAPGTDTCVEVEGQEPYWFPGSDTFVPTQGTDDAYVDDTANSIDTTDTFLRFGTFGDGNTLDLGVRFRSVAVPTGVTITSAIIRFTAASTDSVTTCNADIVGEDNGTPAVFSTYADFAGRDRTTAVVDWDGLGTWTVGNTYDTPDISTIIQEIIDRGDWADGNDLVVFVEDDGSSVGAFRTPASYENVTHAEAQLILAWMNPEIERGRSETCDDEVYIANKWNEANITHIYIDDGGAVGGNLLEAALPYDLLPAAPAQNDAIYFGIDTSLADSGPFCSLVFDIGTAAVYAGGETMIWEYWNGAWVTLDVLNDETGSGEDNPFENTGVNSVGWEQADDWVAVNLNTALGYGPAVTGYWVRARCNTAGVPTTPTQQTRHIYSIVWPYVELASDQVAGDISALARIKIRDHNNDNPMSGEILNVTTNRLLCGARLISRGDDFRAFLNCAGSQLPTGVTVAYGGSVASTAASDTITGAYARFNPAGLLTSQPGVYFTISASYADQYRGEYHCFVRCKQDTSGSGAAGDFWVSLWVSNMTGGSNVGAAYSERQQVYTYARELWNVLDMGRLTVPGDLDVIANETYSLVFGLDLRSDRGASPDDLFIYDLILIPVDEWASDSFDHSDTAFGNGLLLPMDSDNYLSLDSSLFQKIKFRSILNTRTDEAVEYIWASANNGPATLTPNESQRLWFFTTRGRYVLGSPSLLTDEVSEPWLIYTVQLFKNQRYLSMRGDR
jgi:hypothetical protein